MVTGRLSPDEIEIVVELRTLGKSYSYIAELLDCSRYRVRDWCRNNGLAGVDNDKIGTETNCVHCGESFIVDNYGQKYCSLTCGERARNSKKRLSVRVKNKTVYDKDISLKKLFIRDKGKCYLCNEICDTRDYSTNDEGYRVTGDKYPSVDHVKPLSKGGTHTWDNIKLAHFGCNRLKSNNV